MNALANEPLLQGPGIWTKLDTGAPSSRWIFATRKLLAELAVEPLNSLIIPHTSFDRLSAGCATYIFQPGLSLVRLETFCVSRPMCSTRLASVLKRWNTRAIKSLADGPSYWTVCTGECASVSLFVCYTAAHKRKLCPVMQCNVDETLRPTSAVRCRLRYAHAAHPR